MDAEERASNWLFENVNSQLTLAVFENHPRRVSACLAQGGNANLRGWKGETLLFLAADKSKDQAIAEELLARGANLRLRDESGKTPLHVAAGSGNVARIKLFLDHGAQIDDRDAHGRTPLHHTTMGCRLEEATFLVGRGADVSIRDHEGRTPLEHARDWRPPERHPFRVHRLDALERLLGGFMTAKVVEVRPDSLIVRVEEMHSKFTEAERQAKERGTLAIPCGIFRGAQAPGDLVRCEKGLSLDLDEAWNARKRDIGIGRER